MKISLIRPQTVKILDSEGNNVVPYRTKYIHLGLLTVGSVLQESHFIDLTGSNIEQKIKEVKFREETFFIYKVGDEISQYEGIIKKSEAVLITSNIATESNLVLNLIGKIKKINNKTKVIVGGQDVSTRTEFYAKNKNIDFAYKGFGLDNLVSLIENNFQSSEKIINGGIDYLVAKGIFPRIDLIENVESYSDSHEGPLPDNVGKVVMPSYPSFGCNEKCKCIFKAKAGKLQYELELTKKYYEWFRKFGSTTIINDENFSGNLLREKNGRETLIEFFNYLKGLGFAWEFGNTVGVYKFVKDNKADEELIKTMFGSEEERILVGCYGACLSFGMMNKISYEKAKPFLEKILDKNIFRLSFNTLSDHSVTKEELELNFKMLENVKQFVRKHNSNTLMFFNHYFLRDWFRLGLNIDLLEKNLELIQYMIPTQNLENMDFFYAYKLARDRLRDLNECLIVNKEGKYNYIS